MQIRHPKDFASGLMFIGFGAFDLIVSSNYPLGTAARMGPGYFPLILGILLLVFGILLTLRSFRLEGERLSFGSLVPPGIVLGSVVLFGIIVAYAGLVASAVLLILIASSASSEFRWKEALISAIVLTTMSVLGFVYALGLQFPVWPSFLGGQ